MSANRLSSQVINGRFESSAQGCCVGSTTAMPNPTQYNYGVVIQYLGDTGDGFIKNHFYRCESGEEGYHWADATPIMDIIYTPDMVMGTNMDGLLVPTEVTRGELRALKDIEGNVQEQLDTLTDDLDSGLAEKVDKVAGMGLSQESYSTREQEKLASIAFGAQVNNIEEVQINNVTVQPTDKIVNLSILEGHTYPMGNLASGEGFEVKHNLIRTIFSVQVRDGQGAVVTGSMTADNMVATIIPDRDATDCTMYIICGGI